MSTPHPRLASPIGGAHPAVLDRRIRDLLLLGVTGLIPLVIALGITTRVSNPSFLPAFGLMLGGLGVFALMASARYEITLTLVALYLGLLDGPVKLGSAGGSAASASRDVLIIAVCLGAVVRLIVSRERVRLPPLSGWVLAFVALVVAEAFNPNTHGILKVLGGFRQQLEWIPFFFFGYLLMRSKERFRKLFVLLGMIALVNGLVGTVQTRLTPGQLASWGPGYKSYVHGGTGTGTGEGQTGLTGRTYLSEGVARVRPPALGSDEGFGGSVGTLALAGTLALMTTGRLRRRWAAPLLCLGAVLAISTSLQRTQVLGAVAVLVGFALLSLSADRRAMRPLAALLAVIAMAFALGAVLAAAEGPGTFSRYLSITPSNAGSTTTSYREKTLLQIPTDIKSAPFGVGLSTVGAGAGFGGKVHVEVEEKGASAESQYNFVTLELGLLGLLLWIALSVKLIVLGVRGVRRVDDVELRIYLAAIFATIIAFSLIGLGGPTMSAPPFGPFFWFATGIAAYWFAGPGRAHLTSGGSAG